MDNEIINLEKTVIEPITVNGSELKTWVKLSGETEDGEIHSFQVRPENTKPGYSFTIPSMKVGVHDLTINIVS